MLGNATLTAFVATTDAARSRSFYGGTLGLPLLSEDQFALVFDCTGIQLRIQVVKELHPQSFTVLGWQVTNVRQTVSALTNRGVALERYPYLQQDDVGVWRAPSGAKVAWFKDPDGNLLSVTEPAAMAAHQDSQMPVMTVLEARVSEQQWADLVQLYERGASRLPPQMLQTFLVQSDSDRELWRGISIWRSRAALEEYRRSVQTPGGIAMFRAVGAEPTLGIWTVGALTPAGGA
jgi:catechol 2,3-dioxygenase-like lactoylglutathione lyase family enzyme